jgi:hypothetical protein
MLKIGLLRRRRQALLAAARDGEPLESNSDVPEEALPTDSAGL